MSGLQGQTCQERDEGGCYVQRQGFCAPQHGHKAQQGRTVLLLSFLEDGDLHICSSQNSTQFTGLMHSLHDRLTGLV